MFTDLAPRARDAIENSPTARKAGGGVKWMARAGYAAHGILYITVGALAFMVATGNGDSEGERLDGKGALHELHQKPFGQVLLVVMAAGLIGFTLWSFVQAILDPEREAKDGIRGVFWRMGRALGGIVHGALVVYAVGLLTGTMLGGSGGDKAKSWSARLMSWDPWGAWVVGAVGAIFLGLAAWQLWLAWKSQLDERLDLERLRSTTRAVVVNISRFGLAARAVVSALVGTGLVIAAFRADPNRVQDAAEAIDRLRGVPYGAILLIVVAFGLAAYGVYELIEAQYRRIRPV